MIGQHGLLVVGERIGSVLVEALWIKEYLRADKVHTQIGVRVLLDGAPRENAVRIMGEDLQQEQALRVLRAWVEELV